MTRWTEIRYRCACMPAEGTVQVPERGDQEDIGDFMCRVTHALSGDHTRRSPLCLSSVMLYAKVPVEGDVIGGARGGTA